MNADASAAPSPERIVQLGLAFWGAKTLLSAVELGVFTELGKGPSDWRGLAQAVGMHPRAAHDFLDALVALGLLDREGELYRNSPETALFLDKAKPSYVGGLLEMANARLYPFWGALTQALRTGQPQNEGKGGGRNFFAAIYAEPERLREFLRAMSAISMGAARAIAAKFPWSSYHTFVDIGCAEGAVPVVVVQAHPHLQGGGYDLPQVEPLFLEYVTAHGVADRVRFYTGDFFRDPLPEADVLIMGHILHDWNLEEKQLLIAKAYRTLPEGGALIVHESIIDDERRHNAFGLLMSLNMLIETPGGFDYTGAECQEWMRVAGFRETRVEPLVGPDSMVVGIK